MSTSSPRNSKNKKTEDNDGDDDEYGNDDEFEKEEEEGEEEDAEKQKRDDIEKENKNEELKSKTVKTVTNPENTEYCKESFFLENEESAARRVLELKTEGEIINKREFLKWKKKTDSEIKEKEEKDVRDEFP